MRRSLSLSLLFVIAAASYSPAQTPFDIHGRLKVAHNGTHLEHADGKPFFVLADTCWTGPALSTAEDWKLYLEDRRKKGFTAIQFNIVSPWSAAPTDAEGRVCCKVVDGKLEINEAFYKRIDERFKAINDAGLLAMPVMCWALRKDIDLGTKLTTEQAIELCKFERDRYRDRQVLWILAGDNPYNAVEAAKWKAVGRAVFGNEKNQLVTTHPTGMNWPWASWEGEKWLNVLGYQSGHGDSDATWKWLHSGPPAEYGKPIALEAKGDLAWIDAKPNPILPMSFSREELEKRTKELEKKANSKPDASQKLLKEWEEKAKVRYQKIKALQAERDKFYKAHPDQPWDAKKVKALDALYETDDEERKLYAKLGTLSSPENLKRDGDPAKVLSFDLLSRPVMNLEPPYEGHNGYQSKKPHSDFSTRRATYWSLLVHPPMGVTYGGHGVWSWNQKPGVDPTGHPGTGPAKSWKDSLDHPGATQMGHVRKLFETVGFQNLRPANILLVEQPGDKDPKNFVACAASADLKTIVVYSPTGRVSLKPGTVPANGKLSWFNPRTGEWTPAEKGKFTAPTDGDWVYVIMPE